MGTETPLRRLHQPAPRKDFVPIAPSLAGPFSSPRPTPQSNGSSSSPFSSILHTLIPPSPHFRGEGAIGPSTLLLLLPYFAPGVLSISFLLDGQAKRRPVRRIPLCWDPRRRNSASAPPPPSHPPPHRRRCPDISAPDAAPRVVLAPVLRSEGLASEGSVGGRVAPLTLPPDEGRKTAGLSGVRGALTRRAPSGCVCVCL